ncbi:XRE family transcriptional regulator [Staphylococcus succinus]|uniref:XRE family transcriptional regulator n=1 Tax=Staphylococcus succinus TaxID=61015 RepID=UPI003F5B5ACC
MIIEKVKNLMDSDISATEIEKATGVDASSIRRIRRGERKLENLSFEKGVALYEYAKSYLKNK